MSLVVEKNPIDEMIIRIRSDATVLIEKHTGDIVNCKYIHPDDFFTCIKNSTAHIGIESGILPDNTVFYREEQDGTRRIILRISSGFHEITYYDSRYKAFPLPTMVFGFVLKSDRRISSKKLAIVEDGILKDESKLYYYPFSNVDQHSFEVCVGRNRLKDIHEIRQLGSLPHFILSMPNNDDYFNSKYNKMGIGYRELLEYLKDKEAEIYYSEVLIESKTNMQMFIKNLKDSY